MSRENDSGVKICHEKMTPEPFSHENDGSPESYMGKGVAGGLEGGGGDSFHLS